MDYLFGIRYYSSNLQHSLPLYKLIHIFHLCHFLNIYFSELRWWVCRCICSHRNICLPILGTNFHFWFPKEMDAKDRFLLKNWTRQEWKLSFWDFQLMLPQIQIDLEKKLFLLKYCSRFKDLNKMVPFIILQEIAYI